MKIEERVKKYIDDEGKRHEYTEVVQINEDGTEIIRATVDRAVSYTHLDVYKRQGYG